MTRTPTRTPTFTRTPTPGPAIATLVLQEGLDGYAGTRDTYLDKLRRDDGARRRPEMEMRYEMGLNVRTMLVRFGLGPLDTLPAGSVINEAVLGLWVTHQSNPNYLWINSYRLLRPLDGSRGELDGGADGQSRGASRAPADRRGPGRADVDDRASWIAHGVWFYQDWTYLIPIWRAIRR